MEEHYQHYRELLLLRQPGCHGNHVTNNKYIFGCRNNAPKNRGKSSPDYVYLKIYGHVVAQIEGIYGNYPLPDDSLWS